MNRLYRIACAVFFLCGAFVFHANIEGKNCQGAKGPPGNSGPPVLPGATGPAGAAGDPGVQGISGSLVTNCDYVMVSGLIFLTTSSGSEPGYSYTVLSPTSVEVTFDTPGNYVVVANAGNSTTIPNTVWISAQTTTTVTFDLAASANRLHFLAIACQP